MTSQTASRSKPRAEDPVAVSILIVNWNTCSYLKQGLQSVRETVKGIAYEVIVVDNASQDGSAEMVRRDFPEFRLVENPQNLGFARGNNHALSLSHGEYVLLMNPDVILEPDTVRGLMAFAQEHPDAALLSPKLLNPDRTLQNFYGRIPTLSTVFFVYTWVGSWIDARWMGGRIRRRDRYEAYGDFQEVLSFTDGGAGLACTLIPRRIIEEFGFMDERFPVFFNDGDLAMRLFREGYRAYILPHVKAVHYGGSSVKQLDRLAYNREFVYGLRAFYRKYRGFLYNLAIDSVLALNVFAEFLRNLKAVVRRAKPLSSLFEPFVQFSKTLSYRPASARPHVFRLPSRTLGS
jgi:GT2 family glycosyltransferase